MYQNEHPKLDHLSIEDVSNNGGFDFDDDMNTDAHQPKEDFQRVLNDVDGNVYNNWNEVGIRAYTAAALTRIADGIETHNKLLRQLLAKMEK